MKYLRKFIDGIKSKKVFLDSDGKWERTEYYNIKGNLHRVDGQLDDHINQLKSRLNSMELDLIKTPGHLYPDRIGGTPRTRLLIVPKE